MSRRTNNTTNKSSSFVCSVCVHHKRRIEGGVPWARGCAGHTSLVHFTCRVSLSQVREFGLQFIHLYIWTHVWSILSQAGDDVVHARTSRRGRRLRAYKSLSHARAWCMRVQDRFKFWWIRNVTSAASCIVAAKQREDLVLATMRGWLVEQLRTNDPNPHTPTHTFVVSAYIQCIWKWQQYSIVDRLASWGIYTSNIFLLAHAS